MAFRDELSKKLGLEAAVVTRKKPVPPGSIASDVPIENPQPKPRNQPMGDISRTTGPLKPESMPKNIRLEEEDIDIDKYLADSPIEEVSQEPEATQEEEPAENLLDSVPPEQQPSPATGLDTEADVLEQTKNKPNDTMDEQSESLTASADVVKKLDDLIKNWNNTAEELGLTDPTIKVIELDSKDEAGKATKINLLDFFNELGESLKVVKDAVVTINTMVANEKGAEDDLDLEIPEVPESEPIPEPIPEPSSVDDIAASVVPDLELGR